MHPLRDQQTLHVKGIRQTLRPRWALSSVERCGLGLIASNSALDCLDRADSRVVSRNPRGVSNN